MASHRLLIVAITLFAGACGSDERPLIMAPTDESEGPVELTAAPLTVELQTDRPHVIRLTEPAEAQSTGRFQISSTIAGVMVSLDGDAPVPLPATLEVPPGPHQLRATCPDSSTETLGLRIESGDTVRLQVCGGRRRP